MPKEIEELKKANYDLDLANLDIKRNVEATTNTIKDSLNRLFFRWDIGNKKYNSMPDDFKKSSSLDKENLDLENIYKLIKDLKRNNNDTTDLVNKAIDIVKTYKEKTMKGDLWGAFYDFISQYKEWLLTLSSEQLACLTNAVGFIFIISALNALVLNYYGTKMINHFNLESKYPKLAKFIRIISKIAETAFKLDILYIYLICIVMLVIDIYMFFP